MKHAFRHLFYLLLAMFSLFGCFKKKESYPKNIREWVDATFPGQLEVLDANQNYDIVDWLTSGKKIAVVADKADHEVQFTLNWSKPTEQYHSLGLDSAEVKAKLDTCRADVHRARELFTLLKNNGLQQFSVSSIEQSAYIVVFAEPTPAARQQIITIVKNTLDARKEQPQTSIWIEILEPSYYHKSFQDIVPHAEWQRPGTEYSSNKIMTLSFEWKKGIQVAALMKGWELNMTAARCDNYEAEAYPQALAWAEKNLPKPFYLEPTQMIAYNLEKMPGEYGAENPMTVRYSFPYFKSKPAEPADSTAAEVNGPEPEGYVTGFFNVDDKTFTKIKRVKDW